MKIVPYEEKYRNALRQICLTTASAHPREKRKCRYLLSMYCDPYLDHGIVYVLLNEEDDPCGYVLCAPDHDAYKNVMGSYLKQIPFPYTLMGYGELMTYKPYAVDYPSHLHIDVLEEYTGSGSGTKLLHILLSELKRRKIRGIMLNVSTDNHRAIRFYQKSGFQILKETKTMFTMGQKLL